MYVCLHVITRYSCHILMELESSQQIFEKYPCQISQKSVQWEPSCSMQKERHDEANARKNQTEYLPLYVLIFRRIRVNLKL